MRKTKEEAEITRQKLLDAALKVFSRQGYADTRLEDIAQEANVTRGAIYHHFGGKVEVYDALVNERFARTRQALEAILAQGKPPLETLRLLMLGSLQLLEEDRDYRVVQELVLFKTAFVPELEKGMQAKIEQTQAFIATLSGLIQAGKDSGEIRTDVQPLDAAIAMIGLINGVSTTWLLNRQAFALKERADAIVDSLLHGLATHA
jgi:TetR/AcrR family transcriptional regulator, acrAB operon repressor